ncbi:hypothetical protein JTB14_014020 [Gonioctena quinquepunctata]|nr:hypothetical protein JTB14_014020 [Gonioctena quinquepunctata]
MPKKVLAKFFYQRKASRTGSCENNQNFPKKKGPQKKPKREKKAQKLLKRGPPLKEKRIFRPEDIPKNKRLQKGGLFGSMKPATNIKCFGNKEKQPGEESNTKTK